jgi:serine/threonine protein kinase/formylglycine-generating enzyme required for sulfatase activity
VNDKDKTKKGSSPDPAKDPTRAFAPSFAGKETAEFEERVEPIAREGGASEQDLGAPADGVEIQGKVVKKLGEYRILRELGHGGMGVVYEAVQESLGRHVALKVLPFHSLMDKSHLERFWREAKSAAMLHHPNIVPVFGVGEHDGIHYYAMQFIRGKGLDKVIEEMQDLRSAAVPFDAQGKGGTIEKLGDTLTSGFLSDELELPPDPTLGGSLADGDAVELPPPRSAGETALSSVSASPSYCQSVARAGMQVAQALAYANSMGILHRDIKPSNLLLDQQGTIWVTDFGLAKAEGGDQITQTGDILGTLAFMAPERFEGWSDPRSDIFSLGLTLYELLTLRPAFEDIDRRRLIKKLTEEDPIRPRKIDRRVPVDLETIVMKAIAKDPHQRYQSAAQMADDLGRFLRQEPIQARPPSARYHLKLFVRRQRRVLTAGGVVLLLSILGFGAYSWHRDAKYIRDSVDEASVKIQSEDFERAEDILVQLERNHRDHPEVLALARRLARGFLNRGKEHWKQFGLRKEQIRKLETAYQEKVSKKEPWAHVSERGEELKAWESLQKAHRETDERFQKAVSLFNKALGVVRADFKERGLVSRALEETNWNRYQAALSDEPVRLDPEYYWAQIEGLGIGTYKSGKVVLGSDPPGAQVYCFRYEEKEAHLVPIPFDPARGLQGKPFLEVERIWNQELSPLRAGDRLLQVGASEVQTEGDLARALKAAGSGEAVEITVLRAGKKELLRWTPFPGPKEEKPGGAPSTRFVSSREQFGLTFSGYPLELAEGCRVGITQAGSPLQLVLPRGSYLLVLRKEGHAEARFPVAMPRRGDLVETVRLLKETEIPPGLIYIPAGPFFCGGDMKADQSLEPGEHRLEGFFMGRREITFGEYVEFLNEREIDNKGKAPPATDFVKQRLAEARKPEDREKVRLLPFNDKDNSVLVEKDSGGHWFVPQGRKYTSESPVLGLSQLAAIEYAHWREEKEGKRWSYRLPTDLEWEKAARGADRRFFVWGNYPVWSFCCSTRGKRGSQLPAVESYPLDESVFGVRDLGGGVSEYTLDKIDEGFRFVSRRGGNTYDTDELWIHIASRNGIFPEFSAVNTGFRLVAELRPAAR